MYQDRLFSQNTFASLGKIRTYGELYAAILNLDKKNAIRANLARVRNLEQECNDGILEKKSIDVDVSEILAKYDSDDNEQPTKVTKKKRKTRKDKQIPLNDIEGWKELRLEVLSFYGSVCMCCGSKDKIHVDHIKPRSIYPELTLEFDNLQVLCCKCNFDKGLNETDYREVKCNKK